MKFFSYLSLIGTTSGSATMDESYDDSLSSCLEFASQFDNTCTDLSNPHSFDTIPTKEMSC